MARQSEEKVKTHIYIYMLHCIIVLSHPYSPYQLINMTDINHNLLSMSSTHLDTSATLANLPEEQKVHSLFWACPGFSQRAPCHKHISILFHHPMKTFRLLLLRSISLRIHQPFSHGLLMGLPWKGQRRRIPVKRRGRG